MFSPDFYPTPADVIDQMLYGYDITGKVILEPEGGKGDIVDYCIANGAKEVIACENNQDLKKILQTKCRVIADDFLTVTSDQVSHIDMIVMNPPFSADEKHILHAFEIAPPGCQIIALCNEETVNERYYNRSRQRLVSIIEQYGHWRSLRDCFSNAERPTDVWVALVTLKKPGVQSNSEFEGFFLDEDPEEEQANAIMPYNFVRDLVNRYVGAIQIFDEQLDAAVKMNNLTSQFFNSGIALSVTQESKPLKKNEYKKELQKAAWKYIFEKLDMQKHATRGLREDINRFVEQQQQIPFTMRNIYRMLDIVIGTTASRMDRAILEAFDKLTQHYDDNRYFVEGWKTNSHYLVNQTFILPYIVDDPKWHPNHVRLRYSSNGEIIDDVVKALCFITGMNYDNCSSLGQFVSNIRCNYGQWYSWGFFEIKGFKKGTMHFRFQNQDLWVKFNQHVARLKGYPLYEPKAQNAYQQRQTGRAHQEKSEFRKFQDEVSKVA